jgi:hypothetical protein
MIMLYHQCYYYVSAIFYFSVQYDDNPDKNQDIGDMVLPFCVLPDVPGSTVPFHVPRSTDGFGCEAGPEGPKVEGYQVGPQAQTANQKGSLAAPSLLPCFDFHGSWCLTHRN